jgi:hypothetical protein
MGFKQFFIEGYQKRGFILPNGKFVDLEEGELSGLTHTQYSSTHHDMHPEEMLVAGGVRIVWWGSSNHYVNGFEWVRGKIKSRAKSKIKLMTEDTFMEGGKVIYEVYTFPSFESDYEEFTDLESALEYLGRN